MKLNLEEIYWKKVGESQRRLADLLEKDAGLTPVEERGKEGGKGGWTGKVFVLEQI